MNYLYNGLSTSNGTLREKLALFYEYYKFKMLFLFQSFYINICKWFTSNDFEKADLDVGF